MKNWIEGRATFSTMLGSWLGLAMVVGCGTSTIHVAPDSSRRGGSDSYAQPSSPTLPPSETRSAKADPVAPRFPKCSAEESAKAKFPEKSEGAAYRAIVRLTISPDGTPQDECFLLVEGPPELEGKALEGRSEWRYNPAFAGQKRDVVVTYRFR